MNEKPKEQASEWTTDQMNEMTNERSNDNSTNETRLEFHETSMNQNMYHVLLWLYLSRKGK